MLFRSTNDHASWNGGAEGPTDDPGILALRARQKRNLIATLLLSQGVPMICGGDELGHTQQGNNNTYCHDSELTWLDWPLDEDGRKFLEFVRRVIALRRQQPVFQRRNFFQGRRIRGAGIKDISWLTPSGHEMNDEAWNAGFVRCLGVRLAGRLIGELDEKGGKIVGDTLLILLNAHHEAIPFTLPVHQEGHHWERLLDTASPDGETGPLEEERPYDLQGRSLAVFRMAATAPAPAPPADSGAIVGAQSR